MKSLIGAFLLFVFFALCVGAVFLFHGNKTETLAAPDTNGPWWLSFNKGAVADAVQTPLAVTAWGDDAARFEQLVY